MALARSCLTLWVSCILMLMFVDPPNHRSELSLDDQNPTPVGEGRGVFQLGLVQVS
jgi:hypothetical protein